MRRSSQVSQLEMKTFPALAKWKVWFAPNRHNRLRPIRAARITVLVSSRFATIRMADRVVVFHGARLISFARRSAACSPRAP
jgi:hypothetical protein